MPKNQQWLKIEVTRHFEGIPRPKLKNVLALQRPIACPKAIEFAQDRIKSGGKAAGHTLEQFNQNGEQAKAAMLVTDTKSTATPSNIAKVFGTAAKVWDWWNNVSDSTKDVNTAMYIGDIASSVLGAGSKMTTDLAKYTY